MYRTVEEKLEVAVNVEQILKEKGFDYGIEYKKVWKNNVELDGLMIRSEDESITPTVYFTEESAEELAQRVVTVMDQDRPNFDLEGLFQHEYFEKNLRPRMIADTEANRRGLEENDIPYYVYPETDLLASCELIISSDIGGTASIHLRREHFKMADYTFHTALLDAVLNAKEDATIQSMREVLMDMMNIPWDEAPEGFMEDDCPMYVISNKNKHYGASVILSPTVREMILEKCGCSEAYILPSSVHEVIAIPIRGDESVRALSSMVEEVNATQVSPEERLIDGVYKIAHDQFIRVA